MSAQSSFVGLSLRRRRLRWLAYAVLACAGPVAVEAQSTWTGVVGSWSDPANWNPATSYPGQFPDQDAVVMSGTPTLDDDFTIRNFTFSGGTLAAVAPHLLSVGTLNWSAGTIGSTVSIDVSGAGSLTGTLSNSGTITVNDLALAGSLTGGTLTTSGQFDWVSGAMNGGGRTTVASTSTLHLAGADKDLSSRELVNNGTIDWSGSVTLNVRFGAVVRNNGTLNASGDATMVLPSGGGGALLVNAGTLSKSAGSGTSSLSLPFDNAGVVAVASGTLSINGGGTGSASSAWSISSGAALRFASNDVNPYEIVSGAALSNGGTLINAGYLKAPASLLAGNNLVMDPTTAAELCVVGDLPDTAFAWNRGALSGPGTTTTGGRTFSSSWGVAGGRVLENSGSIAWTGGVWGLGYTNKISAFDNATPGTIRNLPGARFDVEFDTDLGLADLPGVLIVDNQGTFAVAAAKSVNLYGAMNNTGTVALASGATLALGGGGTSSGTFAGQSGSSLIFSGATPHILTSASRIVTSGGVIFQDGQSDLHGTIGVASITTAGGTVTFHSGGLSSTTTLLTTGGTTHIDGTLIVSGTMQLQSGVTTISGTGASAATTTVDSTDGDGLRIESGARFVAGDYTQSGRLTLNGGTLAATGTAQLTSFYSTVAGAGTIDASLSSAGGTITPGIDSNPGETKTMNVIGNLTLDADSTLLIDVNATTHSADAIHIGGSTNLGGAFLLVKLTGSPTGISSSETFMVVSSVGARSNELTVFGPLTGMVDVYDSNFDVVGAFHVSYIGNDVVLHGYVPEPGIALALMSLGTILSARSGRRSSRR